MANPLILLAIVPAALGITVFLMPVVGTLITVSNDPVLWDRVLAYYTDDVLRKALLRSFMLPAAVTLLSLIMGLISSLIYYFSNKNLKNLVRLSMLIPLFLHPMVLVFGLLAFLRQGPVSVGVDNIFQWLGPHGGAWGSVVIIMTLLLYPFVGWFAIIALDRVPWDEQAAARNLGARPIQVLNDVVLPHIRDALWAGAVIVFIQATGFFVVPVLMGDGWVNTLPVLLVDNIDVGLNMEAQAIASALIVPISVLAIFGIRRIVSARLIT